MKATFIISIIITLIGASDFCKADVTFEDLFHISRAEAKSSLGVKRLSILQAALEDFNAVLNYKRPVHAIIDKNAPVLGDGGTLFYKAHGYTLTIQRSLFSMGDGKKQINGFLYGPILAINVGIGSGNDNNISSISFYPADKLYPRLKRERK